MDWLSTCRYCKHWDNGTCTNSRFTGDDGAYEAVYDIAESGKLEETAKESAGSIKADELIGMLAEWNVSKKRRDEFAGALREFMENAAAEIGEDIHKIYMDAVESSTFSVEISDPYDFKCSDFE
ncbi:MAG: hypothetical protein IJ711_00405 [Lachnospiraceae bacterium]|nr:hypothetical protein [Clostridia bacterium]MBR1691217.1 hypothetical protein [Lachnospiraceae bacterium]